MPYARRPRPGCACRSTSRFWAPRWAVARPGPDPTRERYAPDPRAFAAFAEAVARRYSGRFPDPARRGRRLPAVRLWTTWNEPNNPDFLLPQWQRDGAGWRPASPHVYRRMHEAAYDAIKRVDARDLVLVGGTAANGRDAGPGGGIRPLRFLRELACVDAALRPLHVPECAGYRPLRADGYAQHPYGLLHDPGVTDPAPDDVRLADLGRLRGLLDELAARGRIARGLPIYVTEYGFESRPPDPYAPFDPSAQARFHGHATYLAWAAGASEFAQFLFRDVPPGGYGGRPGTRRYWSDFQTGLEDPLGGPSPSPGRSTSPSGRRPRSPTGAGSSSSSAPCAETTAPRRSASSAGRARAPHGRRCGRRAPPATRALPPSSPGTAAPSCGRQPRPARASTGWFGCDATDLLLPACRSRSASRPSPRQSCRADGCPPFRPLRTTGIKEAGPGRAAAAQQQPVAIVSPLGTQKQPVAVMDLRGGAAARSHLLDVRRSGREQRGDYCDS